VSLTLGHIVEAISGVSIPALDTRLSGAVIDSRQATPGALFVALRGEKQDGHEFVADAFERGAIAALVERRLPVDAQFVEAETIQAGEVPESWDLPLCLIVPDPLRALQQAAAFWRRQIDIRVIGITGSVGKSTTKELIADVLSQRYATVRSPGNLNNEIGLPLSLLRVSEAHERAVLEMGFYVPGEIAELCAIAKPQVGVVTNISEVHLERAGSMQAIVNGKAELVEALPPAPEGVAILNQDDERVRDFASRTQARVFYYGLSPEADLWASEVESLGLEGIRCVVHHGLESIYMRVPLLGRHSVHTVLRATAVGLVEGLTWEEIVQGLQSPQSQLRLIAVQGPHGSLILDDTYNAAPPSIIAALNLLEDLEGRKIAVLGDMLELGEFEERGHRMVGARAAEVADLLVTVGERARWIAEEARALGMREDQVVELPDSPAAVEFLSDRLAEGDVILVKGSRGMRMDQIVTALEERK